MTEHHESTPRKDYQFISAPRKLGDPELRNRVLDLETRAGDPAWFEEDIDDWLRLKTREMHAICVGDRVAALIYFEVRGNELTVDRITIDSQEDTQDVLHNIVGYLVHAIKRSYSKVTRLVIRARSEVDHQLLSYFEDPANGFDPSYPTIGYPIDEQSHELTKYVHFQRRIRERSV